MSKCFTNTIQGDISNILREYIRDIEQYVDNRIKELKDKNTVNDAYKEYLNCYKDVNNINK